MAESAGKGSTEGGGAEAVEAAMVARDAVPPGGGESSATPPKPLHQRPELPEFWDHRFRQGVTPWDAGGTPTQLAEFARSVAGERPRTLIPGCGSAWEAGFLDALGWPVCALDFSPAAIAIARQQLPGFAGELRCADFFSFDAGEAYQLIYERAFLCALPRALWPDYGPRMAELLVPGGRLAGYFFLNEGALRGPPFGIAAAQLDACLGDYFQLVDSRPATDSIGPFAGHEQWMVWQRR